MTSDIKKYDFRKGLSVEFEIVRISDLYKTHKGLLTNPHRAGFYHIIWFQKGMATHLVDFNSIKIKQNSLLFLNKDIVQVFDRKENFDGKLILFTDSFFCKTAADTNFLHGSVLFNDLFSVSNVKLSKATSILADLFEMMEAELKNGRDNYQSDILKNHLYNFLLLAEREKRKQNFKEVRKGPDLDCLLLFKDLLEKQFRKNKQVNNYASQLSMTEKRLNHATIKILGKTPKKMIDDRIMLEAKRLLAHTHESIKEIGFDLGFTEPTNFIKFFKKHNSSTPVEFRERLSPSL